MSAPISRRASPKVSRRDVVAGSGALVIGFSMLARMGSDIAWAQAAAVPPVSPSLSKAPQVDSWIRISAAGEVALLSGKVEIGQGVKTSLAQIVADELDVALQRITVITADTARTPDETTTSRSHSMIESGGALRAAAAEARAFLLAKAAERLNVQASALSVQDGTVRTGSGQITYWAIIGDNKFDRAVSGKAATKPPSAYQYVGKSIPRVDIPGKVTGAPSFVQDLRLPGMLHARVLRPPIDRPVKLQSIDVSRATAMPGVVKVVRNGSFAGVIAEREEEAIRALEALKQDAKWDLPQLPPQAQLKQQLRNLPAKERALRDDPGVADALAKATHRVEASYFVPFQSHGSIGPSCAVAQLSDGALTVWTHSQSVFGLRTDLANVLDMPEGQVRLIHMEGAGCFGQNGADDVPLDAAVLATAVPGRPVRVQWMRQDEFAWAPKGPAMIVDIKAGIDAQGNIVAWDHEYWTGPHVSRYGSKGKSVAIGAWYLERPAAPFYLQGPAADVVARGLAAAEAFYGFPNKRVVEHVTELFSPLRSGELRGVAALPHAFALESMLDELAAKAGMDPIEFRLRFIKDARMRAVIEAAARQAGWTTGRAPPGTSGKGRGFSSFYYDRPMSRGACIAEVEVDRASGRIKINRVVAAFDVGQVINPDGVRNQMEGGIVQALSRTLVEEMSYADGKVTSVDWSGYPLLGFNDLPEIDIVLLDRPDEPPGGAGETQTPIIPGAIANAIYDAVGVRLRDLPFTPARVRAALTG